MKKIGKVAIMGVVVLIMVGLSVGIILFFSEKHPAYLLNGTIVLPDQMLEDGWLIIIIIRSSLSAKKSQSSVIRGKL